MKTFGKILFITTILVLSSISYSQSKVNVNNLVKYGDKWFKENDDKPYTGNVFKLDKNTGKKLLEGKYRDGLKHGKWNEWYKNGNKGIEGSFYQGIKNNNWTWWNEGGNIDSLVTFKNGLPVKKTFIEYFDNNNEKRKSNYVNNKLDGLFTEWYEDGNLLKEGNYKDGSMIGTWKVFDIKGSLYEGEIISLEEMRNLFQQDGSVSRDGNFFVILPDEVIGNMIIKDGIPFGDQVQLFSNGVIKNFQNKEGGSEYYKDGQIKEKFIYRDKNERTFDILIKYYSSGGMKENTKYLYDDNKLIGIDDIEYYENGQMIHKGRSLLIDKTFVRDGLWTQWYDNGKKEYEGSYLNGLKHGLWTWYENGQKVSEGTYKNDEKDGLWTQWYENGQKKEETIYTRQENKLTYKEVSTEWDRKGKKKEITTYLRYNNGDVKSFETLKYYGNGYVVSGNYIKGEGRYYLMTGNWIIKDGEKGPLVQKINCDECDCVLSVDRNQPSIKCR